MMKFWKIENMIVDTLKSSGFWLMLVSVSFVAILCYACQQDKIAKNNKLTEKNMVIDCIKTGNITISCKILIAKQFGFTTEDFKMIEEKTAK